jgi:two-component system sensor histidine kinase MprB
MSFRRRITLASAGAVAIAILLTSLLNSTLVANELRNQVDAQLEHKGRGAQRLRALLRPNTPRSAIIQASLPMTGYQQLVATDGTVVVRSAPVVTLPITDATLRLARHGGAPFFRSARVNGVHLRLLTEPFGPGRAIEFAQPLTETDKLLSRLMRVRVLVGLAGVALAALFGGMVASAAVRPLRRLTMAAEHVAETRDLSERIEPTGEDEIGRLAVSFNAMLDALERSMNALDASVHAQRQLVADASHELRTPVTSMRTNVEILQQAPDMDPAERQWMLGEVVDQIEELTLLMNDLIDLARGDETGVDSEDVRLDLVVSEVVERARKRAPETPVEVELEPTVVAGLPARLERAVSNLVDNAIKYSAPGEPVEVALHGKELTVRDHGPGISTEDLPHVFDRFYRGAHARGRAGSGLGLAIVRQVVDQQGGSVAAEAAPGGGTLMRMRLAGAESLRPAGVTERALAENGGRESEPAAERPSEVRSMPVADEAGDVLDGDRPLLDQQLGRR